MIKNIYKITCDHKDCYEYSEFESEGKKFNEIIEEAKQEGWHMFWNDETGRYEHYCPDHAYEFL